VPLTYIAQHWVKLKPILIFNIGQMTDNIG
jgi:hypothetical protein